jgi:hypothetical protein
MSILAKDGQVREKLLSVIKSHSPLGASSARGEMP